LLIDRLQRGGVNMDERFFVVVRDQWFGEFFVSRNRSKGVENSGVHVGCSFKMAAFEVLV
jgi:hypothetical protein